MRLPHTLMFAPDEGSGIPGSSGPLQPGEGLAGIPGAGPTGTPAPTPAPAPSAAPATQPLTGGGDPPPPVFTRPDAGGTAPVPGEPATYELASWGRRAAATIIDSIILTVILVVLVVIPFVVFGVAAAGAESTGGSFELSDELSVGAIVLVALWAIFVFAVILMYAPLTMARSNGATPGKAAMGIRVVRENGQPISITYGLFREAVIKTLLIGGISQLTLGLAWLLDSLWPLWDDQKRALHDMAAKSRVVRG